MMPEFAVSERESLFHHVYLILNGLVRHRRESVLHVIPHLFRALRDLLQCFREDPLNIPLALKTDDSSPPFCAILCPRLKPLGVKPAALYSDLVLSLTQRPLLEVTSGSSGSDETHLMTQTASFIKPFSKHAPMLLLAMVSIQSSRRPFDIDCKKELTQGIYYLLDLCNDHGRSFALAALDANGGGRPILKTWVSDWEKYHRFRGDA